MQATCIYIHFNGELAILRAHLFDLTARGVLLGAAIPRQYTVHKSEVNARLCSVDLTITNGGQEIDTSVIQEYASKWWVSKGVTVGIYDTMEISETNVLEFPVLRPVAA